MLLFGTVYIWGLWGTVLDIVGLLAASLGLTHQVSVAFPLTLEL